MDYRTELKGRVQGFMARDGPIVMEICGKDSHTRLAQPNKLNFKKQM